jgi:hypothetical protein
MSARFYRNPVGRGFASGLPCQAPSEGDQPFASSSFAHPIPQSHRRANGDLFRASLVRLVNSTTAVLAEGNLPGSRTRNCQPGWIPGRARNDAFRVRPGMTYS